jgi:6-pyruvoyl-tetrahydropterin synthase
MMIAHSLQGEVFGPAQRLHGATLVVDVEFGRRKLDGMGLAVDIGQARAVLRHVVEELDYRNLDNEPSLSGANTTVEYLAKVIHDRMLDRLERGELGVPTSVLTSLRVVLHESHVARAAYESQPSAA